jgi:hypothetical protein
MSTRKPFLDFSQYSMYMSCPLKWYERYVRSTVRAPKEGFQDSALTLGTCVHAGLEVLRQRGVLEIPEEVFQETGVSPDYRAWALRLLQGYAAHYPGEDFPSGHCEAPLRFPLTDSVDGLAKVDYYWKVPPGGQEIADGLGGVLHLEPGWWVKEYKTKDPSRRPGNWVLSWRMGAQADFQCLALAALTGEPAQGIIVDTLEKPALYIPQRTCKGCGAKQDLRQYTPLGGGKYRCELCKAEVALDGSDKSKTPRVPSYYRLKVERSPQALELLHAEACALATEMQAIREGHAQPLRRLTHCVDQTFGACEYFEPHSALQEATGWEGFVKADTIRYVGEAPQEEV